MKMPDKDPQLWTFLTSFEFKSFIIACVTTVARLLYRKPQDTPSIAYLKSRAVEAPVCGFLAVLVSHLALQWGASLEVAVWTSAVVGLFGADTVEKVFRRFLEGSANAGGKDPRP